MAAQTDNVQKFPVKLMSCHFVFNLSVLGQGLQAVLPFFALQLQQVTFRYQKPPCSVVK